MEQGIVWSVKYQTPTWLVTQRGQWARITNKRTKETVALPLPTIWRIVNKLAGLPK